MLALIIIGAFMWLLILAALTDWQTRRIPNRITGAIAFLYLPFVFSHPGEIAWPAAAMVALACFAGGFVLFARRVLGGGDVKLITAVSLWAGPAYLASFTIVMSLTGGVLAIGAIAWQRFGWMIAPHVASAPALSAPAVGDSGPQTDAPGETTLPYGVAIAAGGIAVAVQLMTTL